jgi:hypothetical protein
LGNDDLAQAVSAWNEMADKHGLSQVQRLTDNRRARLKKRLHECGGLDGWAGALKRVTESSFLLGETGRWKADFDFLMQPDSFAKLMEGTYANRGIPNQPRSGSISLLQPQLGLSKRQESMLRAAGINPTPQPPTIDMETTGMELLP